MEQSEERGALDRYFQQVQDIILKRQDWISGLLPASTAVNVHGNYTDAWVRDNVYSILAAWGLGLACRRAGYRADRVYLLEQSVVKLMRGLLTAMMRQAAKVENFKLSQNPMDALHAKYDTKSGNVVVGDHEWGHLQLDATSLYLLMLAQMTASGLRIVFTLDEVNFVQNLVHYISRAYRTPDYGIWERGNKTNHGIAELNASSIGMAKAALEALSGFNLFGRDGGQASVVHVISDDIARTRNTLEALLPRESVSKETDSALLAVTGFPAFAIDNVAIRKQTEAAIKDKLEGRYGCKRFLRDGHQTVIEDSHRLYYEPHELKQFNAIECEWPLFFTYLLLNHRFAGDLAAAETYRRKLDDLLVDRGGQRLLPELYIVPAEAIDAEKAQPHSQQRIPNENVPLVWAQSLYTLGCLMLDGLLTANDIDPLGRHKSVGKGNYAMQVALLAQDDNVKSMLAEQGIPSQTLAETAPIQIREAMELSEAYTHVGRNDRIGLTGRPFRQLRTLATSRIYVLSGEQLVFLPQCLNQKGFYLALDNRLLIERLRTEFSYIDRHWNQPNNPLLVMSVKHNMLDTNNRDILVAFLRELQSGNSQGVSVRLGRLSDFAASSSFEKIDYLHDFRFSAATWQEAERPCFQALPYSSSPSLPLDSQEISEWEIRDDGFILEQLVTRTNLYAQLEALNLLALRHGLDYATDLRTEAGDSCRVRDLLAEVYERAGDLHAWYVLRRCAGLLGHYDINLEQAATEILTRQHYLTVGLVYSGRATLMRPADSWEILETIRQCNQDASEQIIFQELILYLGLLIKTEPELFADMHTVRVGHILQLIIAKQQRESSAPSLAAAFQELLSLPPHQLLAKVVGTLRDFNLSEDQLDRSEVLDYEGNYRELSAARFGNSYDPSDRKEDESWAQWREQKGCAGRENSAFYQQVWDILPCCNGLHIGEKLNSKNYLDSEITLSQMTVGEQSFKLHINHLLNKIQSPVYRQLTVETLRAIAIIFRDSSVHIDDTLITDVIIAHAVRINAQANNPAMPEEDENFETESWIQFYALPPHQVANAILDALIHLLNHSTQSHPIETAT